METQVRTTSFLCLLDRLMSVCVSLDLYCCLRICHHLAMPGAPIPPSCLIWLLFMCCLNFSFTFFFKFYFIFKLYIIVLVLPNIKMNPPQVYNCLILLMFISLISWKWTDPIGWCSFFHSRPQNRSLVYPADWLSFSQNFHTWFSQLWQGGWDTVVLTLASCGTQPGLGWRSSFKGLMGLHSLSLSCVIQEDQYLTYMVIG